MKLIVGKESYQESLKMANIPTLKKRRDMLCDKFATKCVKNEEKNKAYVSKKS